MDYDEQSLNSVPTVADGTRRPAEPYDEPSLGSAPTMVGHGDPGAALGQIDQYQLVRKLGGGGFGVVYLARDTVSGVDVALKTLHPLLKSNPEEMEALRAKFALVSRLSHPNIASPLVLHPCRDIAITDDTTRREMRLSPGDSVMVMRYAPGVTLSKWRRQFPDGVVPLDQALEIVRQVASALDYAHGEKIVHRDIKPANIMVETVGGGESHTEAQRHRESVERIRVRILDFGLAAEIRSSMSRISTETGDTSGTRPYMAPEQWQGRKQDGRTDQYALACVAYDLLSGAPPFSGAFETGDPVVMERAVTSRTPNEIEGLPANVNAALMRALAKNQTDRFSNCSAFAETLSNRNGGTISASEQRPLPRRRVWPWVAALAAVLAIGAVLWRIGGTRESGASSEIDATGGTEIAPSSPVEPITPESSPVEPVTPVSSPMEPVAPVTETPDNSDTPHTPVKPEPPDEPPETLSPENSVQTEAEPKAHEEEEQRKAEAEAETMRKAEEARLAKAVTGTVAGERKVIRIGPQEIALRWCPPGPFTMGSPETEKGHCDGETQHRVTFTKGFWMGETEVTQGLWEEIMGTNPSHFKSGDNYPVENVSWYNCQEFLKELNAHSPQSGLRWALPTEAQWEYACRASTIGAYGVLGNQRDVGWHQSNSGARTHPVAQLGTNAWGVCDMHGNVFEWCADLYGGYPSNSVTDPDGSPTGLDRVYRGGSCRDDVCDCRSAYRGCGLPAYKFPYLGLRVALVAVE